jgi:hypothetical protein
LLDQGSGAEPKPVEFHAAASLPICLSPGSKAALERAAGEEMRSPSSLAEAILVGWLCERGYLPTCADDGLRPEELNASNDD